jgi:ubiquinone/menaquinone biosynthesis C-methylase UbiE
MLFDDTNKRYWKESNADQLLAGVHYPGDELTPFLIKDARVLDVGCGIGKVSAHLASYSCQVTGIDISEAALTAARVILPQATFLWSDITQPLPFPDNSFDVIVVSYVLVSLIGEDVVTKLVAELYRVLVPGGVVWLAEATYSPDYEERYAVGKALTGKELVAVSFEKDEAGNETDVVKRYIRHYTGTELDSYFDTFTLIHKGAVTETSPSSGMRVHTHIAIYKK